MNNNMTVSESTEAKKTYELYGDRSFQDISSGISGRSVVIQKESGQPERYAAEEMWPYSLSDYLKNYIGRMVLIEYIFNSKCYRRRGTLQVVGTNFAGIQTLQNNSIFLIELGSIKSIDISTLNQDKTNGKFGCF